MPTIILAINDETSGPELDELVLRFRPAQPKQWNVRVALDKDASTDGPAKSTSSAHGGPMSSDPDETKAAPSTAHSQAQNDATPLPPTPPPLPGRAGRRRSPAPSQLSAPLASATLGSAHPVAASITQEPKPEPSRHNLDFSAVE